MGVGANKQELHWGSGSNETGEIDDVPLFPTQLWIVFEISIVTYFSIISENNFKRDLVARLID
jgi:hypothetical protein